MAKYILILVTILSFGIFTNESYGFNDVGKEGEIILDKIDFSKDVTLYGIAKNVVEDDDNIGYDVHFYSVYMSDLEGGTLVTVVAETYDNIYGDVKYDGYYMLDNHLFVVVNKGSYNLPPIIPSKSSRFKTYIPDPIHYDPLELRFYVIDGAFAWYVRDIGWVWEITDITKLNTENAKGILTVPKRKTK